MPSKKIVSTPMWVVAILASVIFGLIGTIYSVLASDVEQNGCNIATIDKKQAVLETELKIRFDGVDNKLDRIEVAIGSNRIASEK